MPAEKENSAPQTGLSVRPATLPEMALALDWAAAEGWNPGIHDAAPFHAADPHAFLVGRVAGQAVALISATRYDDSFGFIGFYIVAPAWRGRGHGWRIWQAALARLAGCNIALDGVLAEQDNYRRSGFRLAWRNIRFQGVTEAGAPAPENGSATCIRLAELTPTLLDRFDRQFFPAGRAAFLQAWISQPGTSAFGLVADDTLRGYGVIRPCRTGYKIGPLFADTPALAEALFQRLQSSVPAGQPVFLDVPECNPEALALARRHNMTQCFETARMYTGLPPDISIARTYGITSFELG